MKILFYTEDENIHSLVEGVNHDNMVVSADMDEILELSEQERILIFIDFDGNKKSAEKLNKKLMDGDDIRIIMTEKIKLKELKKHQKGKTAAEGYVRKPLTLKIINEILNDFEFADFVEDSEAFHEGDELGEAPQSSLSDTHGTVYDDDEGDEVDFASNIMKVDDRVKAQIDAHSVGGDGPNFATPINVDIQSKFDMVFDRPFMADGSSPQEEEVNIPAPMEQGGPSPDSVGASPSLDLDMGDGPELDMDMGGEEDDVGELDLSAEEVDEPAAEEEIDLAMDAGASEDSNEVDLDLGTEEDGAEAFEEPGAEEIEDLGIEVEEDEELDLDEGALEFGGAAELPEVEEEVEDESVEGLDFGGGEEADPLLNTEDENDEEAPDILESSDTEEPAGFDLAAESEDDDAEDEPLDLGGDDAEDEPLDLGGDDAEDEPLDLGGDDAEDEPLDLGGDDAEDEPLDLGGDDAEDEPLDLGGDDAEDEPLDLGGDDAEDEPLDLGGDDAEDEPLDLGGDDIEDEPLDLGGDDSGSLDLSAEEPDEVIEEEEDDISSTIEGIVSPGEPSDDGELSMSGEDLDADTDLGIDDADDEDLDLGVSEDVNLEDELNFGEEDEGTGELDLSGEEDEDLDTSDFAEETNPTIVMGADDESLTEFKAPRPDTLAEDDEVLDLGDEETDEAIDLGVSDDDADGDTEAESFEEETQVADFEVDDDSMVTEMLESPLESPGESQVDETQVAKELPKAKEEPPAPKPPAAEPQVIITPEEQRVAEAFNQTEAARLQGTIRQLREEREELLKEIHELRTDSKLGEQERLGIQAELDEAKIEIQILKKRNFEEVDELKYQLRLSEEKKQIYEERAKNVQREFDRLNQKVRIDINQVKQREKELESQLELVTMDSQSQVKSRDMKILELKRKIDALEFNMENASIRELKSREDKEKVEDRLEKIMRTLRGSLKSLETDGDSPDDGILDKIDKL